jgi:hypothetical protein
MHNNLCARPAKRKPAMRNDGFARSVPARSLARVVQQRRRMGTPRIVAREVAPWVERLARLGYVSIGTVYIIAGLSTAAAGFGIGGRTADRGTVLAFLTSLPLGTALLLVIAAGLAGYVVWLVSSAIADAENRGSDPKGLAVRGAALARAIVYGAFAFEAFRTAATHRRTGEGSDAATRHLASRAMQAPLGKWAVAATGIVIIGYALYQLHRAWEARLGSRLHLEAASPALRRKLIAISRFGIAARALIFLVIGPSLVVAAMRHDPHAARGTKGALTRLWSVPFGPLVLVLVGIGLAAFGIYSIVKARYRTVRAI